MATAQQNSDVSIPPPVQQAPDASPTVQTPAASPAPTDTEPSSPGNTLVESNPFKPPGLTGNEIIMGVGIALILAGLFWVVGRILRDTLVKQFAEVGAAKRAGTMLFVLLTVVGTFTTFGFLGNFWLAAFFFIPAALLSFLMLLVFLFSFVAANRSKPR